MSTDCLKTIKIVLILGCALCIAGCAKFGKGRAWDEFAAEGGLFSDWPQFAIQSFESNLLIGKQPVDPPSAYRDK